MKIRCITDVITNSSNETFICRSKPDRGKYKYSYAEELDWKTIVSGGNFDFTKDVMVFILEERLGKTLSENPFPKTEDIMYPWDQADYNGWLSEETTEIWKDFVKLNEDAFRELVGYCYVSGYDDNEYDNYDQWVSDNDDLGDISVLRAGRDQGFYLY